MTPRYEHVQRSPLPWIVGPLFAVVAVVLMNRADTPFFVPLLFVLLPALLLLMFSTFTVSDGGDALLLRYGPLRWIAKRVPYADVRAVEETRTDLLDGFGIHWVPGRGWTWNLWGMDAVRLTLGDGRTLRVGAGKDRTALAAFLREAIVAPNAAS